jgi:hypothetical protein
MATTTYAVTWQDGTGTLHSGKAELRSRALHLDGNGDRLTVPYEHLTGISVAHSAADRIGGRPTLVLERGDGTPVRLASIAQLGIISELAERLASLHLGRMAIRNRLVVVLPLREGAQEDVRRLLDVGPPFDLAEVDLTQHQVFVTEREAIFVFDSDDETDLAQLFHDPNVWAAATVWGEFAAGPARFAEEIFAWAREP